MKLLIATTNRGKFKEIEEALKGLPLEILFLGDLPRAPQTVEDQTTFKGNALKKAGEIAAWASQRGMDVAVLADDSGLVVPALGGRPGIYSARYAGEKASDSENLRKLLQEMQDIPFGKRQAYFQCVLALRTSQGKEVVMEGRCEGKIASEPRGSQGFGYDPIFTLPKIGKTLAELSMNEKNKISHRGQALKKLRELLIHSLFPDGKK
jgi:XTP/dITP diphosphohydrolase